MPNTAMIVNILKKNFLMTNEQRAALELWDSGVKSSDFDKSLSDYVPDGQWINTRNALRDLERDGTFARKYLP